MIRSFLLFLFVLPVCCDLANVNKTRKLNKRKDAKKSLNKLKGVKKSFQQDMEEKFPNLDLSDDDLYSLIAFFEVNTNGKFNKYMSALDELHEKYSNDVDIVRRLYFYKLLLVYIHWKLPEYSEIYKQYYNLFSLNSPYSKHIAKLTFLFNDRIRSNYSSYCIDMKKTEYKILLKDQDNTDFYTELLYDLMMVAYRLVKLKIFDQAISNSYGENWVEACWISLKEINENKSEDLDMYYLYLIMFFVSQGLFEDAYYLYVQMQYYCPNSDLLDIAASYMKKEN